MNLTNLFAPLQQAGAYAYNNYHLVISKRKYLSEFNMEQQADIIADERIYVS